MSNQSAVQAAVRARHAQSGSRDYNSDWHELFDQDGIASGTFNERLLTWINAELGSSHASLPAAMQAYAVSLGFSNWSSMNTIGDGLEDLYPDAHIAFDPVNDFYKIGSFRTDDLATFLARSEVHYSADPTAGFSAAGYEPTDAYKLYVDWTQGNEFSLLTEAVFVTVPDVNDGIIHAWAALASAGATPDFYGVGQRDNASDTEVTKSLCNSGFTALYPASSANYPTVDQPRRNGCAVHSDGTSILYEVNEEMAQPAWTRTQDVDKVCLGWTGGRPSFSFDRASLGIVRTILVMDSYDAVAAQAWTA